MVTQEQLLEVVKRIADNVRPKKVVLFGSYAYGHPTEDSDLDILVIKNMEMPRYRRAAEVRKCLRGLKIPIDPIVYTEEEIEEWKGVKAAFINQVMENGKILYEQ